MLKKAINFLVLNIMLKSLLAASVLDFELVSDGYRLKTSNINESRYYGFPLQVAVINSYNPTSTSYSIALRLPRDVVNSNFIANFGLDASYAHIDYVIQEPSGGCMRAHHVLHPKESGAVPTTCYARFGATVDLRSISPNNVAMDSNGLDINIHPGNGTTEPVLSPNDGHIRVGGEPLRDYVLKNGSVLFLTKIAGNNGRKAATLHFIIHPDDETVIRNLINSSPKTIAEMLDRMQRCNDPLMNYFVNSISGRGALPAIQKIDYFPAGENLLAKVLAENSEFIARDKRAQLQSLLTSVPMLAEDMSADEIIDSIAKIKSLCSKLCLQYHDVVRFQFEKIFTGTKGKFFNSMHSILCDDTISDDDKIKKLEFFTKNLSELYFCTGVCSEYESKKKLFPDFLSSILNPAQDAVQALNKRGYDGFWDSDEQIFCKQNEGDLKSGIIKVWKLFDTCDKARVLLGASEYDVEKVVADMKKRISNFALSRGIYDAKLGLGYA